MIHPSNIPEHIRKAVADLPAGNYIIRPLPDGTVSIREARPDEIVGRPLQRLPPKLDTEKWPLTAATLDAIESGTDIGILHDGVRAIIDAPVDASDVELGVLSCKPSNR